MFLIIILFLLFRIIFSTDCILSLPNNLLSPIGLSTPFILKSLSSNIQCSAVIEETTVFAEATIYDPKHNKLDVYNPLVVNDISQIAIKPYIPSYSSRSIIGIWFSSNKLSFALDNIQSYNCRYFGYFAYCNAHAFFNATRSNPTRLPKLENNCPSIKSFSFVNEYQNYKLLSSYIITFDNKIAQNNPSNQFILHTHLMTIIKDSLDGNRLLFEYIYPMLSCSISVVSSLAILELQSYISRNDTAFIIDSNPMIDNNKYKLQMYRIGVNQPFNVSLSLEKYCMSIINETEIFLSTNYGKLLNKQIKKTNMFDFMLNRFNNTWYNLNCYTIINKTLSVIPNRDPNHNNNYEYKFDYIIIVCIITISFIIGYFIFLISCLVKKHNKDIVDINNKIIELYVKPPNNNRENEEIDINICYEDSEQLLKDIEEERIKSKKRLNERIEKKKNLSNK